jgi:carbon-monoxide dehydrogenase large subunit
MSEVRSAPSQQISERLVGQPVRRVEDARLLTGLGRYVDDRPADHALHVAILCSDQPHARIVSLDTAGALALECVVGVYQWSDIAAIRPTCACDFANGGLSTDAHSRLGQRLRSLRY